MCRSRGTATQRWEARSTCRRWRDTFDADRLRHRRSTSVTSEAIQWRNNCAPTVTSWRLYETDKPLQTFTPGDHPLEKISPGYDPPRSVATFLQRKFKNGTNPYSWPIRPTRRGPDPNRPTGGYLRWDFISGVMSGGKCYREVIFSDPSIRTSTVFTDTDGSRPFMEYRPLSVDR